MDNDTIREVVRRLESEVRKWREPIISQLAGQGGRDPFQVLIGTLLSLRTRDETTAGAIDRLWALADSPQAMALLTPEAIVQAIYPVGFYNNKARTILEVCRQLLERWGGRVPDDLDLLLTLPGVGRKTANLVVAIGYGKDAICVDTHVHRISNRFGYVKTKSPDDTETALRKTLPREHWIRYNDLLVAFGQQLCGPLSPRCSSCPIEDLCPRIGVTHHR
ncbi:MAG: endonuclease III [Pseudomonadota bacterium]